MSEENGRITVSRQALRAEITELLRAELAEFELRLVPKLAPRVDMEKIDKRITLLERGALGFAGTLVVTLLGVVLVAHGAG